VPNLFGFEFVKGAHNTKNFIKIIILGNIRIFRITARRHRAGIAIIAYLTREKVARFKLWLINPYILFLIFDLRRIM